MTLAGLEPEILKRKKRLGQYFTALPLATFLAELADASRAESILDPMAGQGDMLLGALAAGARAKAVHGYEIDTRVASMASLRLEEAGSLEAVRIGDAFQGEYGAEGFDLVITNPPYIRYQRMAGTSSDGDGPTSRSIRLNLLKQIAERAHLAPGDREFLAELTSAYSGHADVAVPSWILAASLVREGGILAILVPQTWLSRDYAAGIRQLLEELFTIRFIVHDDAPSWFDDAQVRTSMIVAHRRTRGSAPAAGAHAEARFETKAATYELLTTPGAPANFASRLRDAAASGRQYRADGFVVTPGVRSATLSGDAGQNSSVSHATRMALSAVLTNVSGLRTSLADLGWSVGQGLRTGANDFFYADSTGASSNGLERLKSTLMEHEIVVPSSAALPVLRRQAELPSSGHLVRADALSGRLLYLRGWATSADIASQSLSPSHKDFLQAHYSILPAGVQDLIAVASMHRPSAHYPMLQLPELSAVRTNARLSRPNNPAAPATFWYHLPELKPRHRPLLALPRVVGGAPLAYMLDEPGVVVDANFSTLWPTSTSAAPATAVLALINSSFFGLLLECNGTVMGGGALKVEASLLAKLTLPDLGPAIASLSLLGEDLLKHGSSPATMDAIDELILGAFPNQLRPGAQGALHIAVKDFRSRRVRTKVKR